MQSQRFHASLVPLVATSTSTETSDQIYLAEEALNLWSAILEQTATPAPQTTAQLFQNLIPSLEVASEMLDRALSILDAYIYLIPSEIIRDSQLIFGKFVPIISGTRREPIGLITNSLDLILNSAVQIGGVSAVEQVVSSLISSNFLTTMLASLRDAYEAHQTTGPNQKYPAIDGVVETGSSAFLSL